MQSSKIDRIKYLVEQLNAASESYYAKDREVTGEELETLLTDTGMLNRK